VAGVVAASVVAGVVAALLVGRGGPRPKAGAAPAGRRAGASHGPAVVTTGGDLVVRLDPPGAAGTCTSVLARLVRATGSLRRLDQPGQCDVLPEISPDHTKIAFTRNNGAGGHAELWVMNADGSGARRVTDQITGGTRSAWSPDGRTLAFAGTAGSASQLFTVSLAPGSTPQQLTSAPGGAASPSWSPTGRLAFVSGGDIYTTSPANPAAWTRLTHSTDRVTEPVWSRDGDRIVYVSGPQGSTDLWIMNADGTGRHPLTTGGHNDEDACWSPDDSTIAFARGPGRGPRIWAVGSGGGEPHEISEGDGTEAQPSW
jgi:Tol biopolymer transport system component